MEITTLNIEQETRSVLAFAVRQSDTLRTKLAPLAAEIFGGDDKAEMAEKLGRVFAAARGEVLGMRLQGKKDAARAASKAWNRLVDGLRYHADKLDLSLTFPNLASGQGELRVESDQEASTRRKAEKADREAADAEALATFAEEQKTAQLDAFRTLSPNDAARTLASMVDAWANGELSMVTLLADLVGIELDALKASKAPTTKPAKAVETA